MMKWIGFTLFFISFSFTVRSQNVTITGYVSNRETGKPVTLVNISTVGNNHLKDDQTDSEGLFVISLKSGVKAGDLIRIRATKQGFETRDERIVVSSLKPITIEMSPTLKTSLPTEKKALGETTLSHYIKNLKDRDSSVRQDACKSLGYMGEKAKAAVPHLISSVLYDGSSSVKISAIEALNDINTSSKEVVESFVTTLKNKDPLVRVAASKALGAISPMSNNAIKALIHALDDKELMVGAYSMQSLILLYKNLVGHIIPLLQVTLVSKDEEVRIVAFNTLRRLDSIPKEVETLFKEFLSNKFFLRENFENTVIDTYDSRVNRGFYNKVGIQIIEVLTETIRGTELLVSIMTAPNSLSISRICKWGSEVIPILNKYLHLDPINKIWIVGPLIHLDSTLKPELQQFIVKASELKVSQKDEIKFWWEVINLLKEYSLSSSDLYAVVVKMILKDTKYTFGNWDYYIKEPTLQLLLDNIDRDSSTVVPGIIKIINRCNSEYYCKVLEAIAKHTPQPENKAIIDSLWSRKVNSQIFCNAKAVFSLQVIRLNMGLLSPDNLISWFKNVNLDSQFGILDHIGTYSHLFDPKIAVPIFIEALEKSTDHHQFASVRGLEKFGPAAIQSVHYLKKAKETTSDIKLKVKIEQAIRIIEDK